MPCVSLPVRSKSHESLIPMRRSLFDVSSSVKAALRHGEPVVALESTILSHGLPYPQNVSMAHEVESLMRACGVVPATIGVLGGRIRVGMSMEEITALGRSKNALKVSRRDFPFILSREEPLYGGTTVSGTSLVAHAMGIQTFVTGGLGGVHRGGELSMDISADLYELQKTSITVVSAGIKSILDVPRTLELLESLGVCVVTYSSAKEAPFPAFFARRSGSMAPYNVGSPEEVAHMMKVRLDMKLNSGMLVGVPIPSEHEVLGAEEAIQTALKEADRLGIRGKDITPFLLAKVSELTRGETLQANLALIKNNAEVGCAIAKEYARLTSRALDMPPPLNKSPIVIGGAAVDLIAQFLEPTLPLDAATHKGKIEMHFGGVGRNIAQGLAQLRLSPLFVSTVGQDNLGVSLKKDFGEDSRIAVMEGKSTATYCVITNAKGEVQSGIGDMGVHGDISPQMIESLDIQASPLIVMDGNIPLSTMNAVMTKSKGTNTPILFEPTDVHKAHKPFVDRETASAITYISPNERELQFILKEYDDSMPPTQNLQHKIHHYIELSQEILCYVQVIVVTLAENGVLLIRRGSSDEALPLQNDPSILPKGSFSMSAKHYPAAFKPPQVLSSSGAGDCFIAGFIASLLRVSHQDQAVGVGMQIAHQSLQNVCAVPKKFQPLNWNYGAKGIEYL